MKITEVRIKLMENPEDRLRGFCSITFDDCFVVRDLKIIEGNNGPFVAMPSRKLTSNCFKCGSKNHLKAHYCNQCGVRLKNSRVEQDDDGRAKLYADIAHPVNAECREMIQNRVIEELKNELALAAKPGYSSRYDDDYFDGPGREKSTRTSGKRKIDVPRQSPQPPNFKKRENTVPEKSKSETDGSSEEGDFGQGIFD
ncbi:MAG: SpoVG family protein [Planctomycetota bacterium]